MAVDVLYKPAPRWLSMLMHVTFILIYADRMHLNVTVQYIQNACVNSYYANAMHCGQDDWKEEKVVCDTYFAFLCTTKLPRNM